MSIRNVPIYNPLRLNVDIPLRHGGGAMQQKMLDIIGVSGGRSPLTPDFFPLILLYARIGSPVIPGVYPLTPDTAAGAPPAPHR